jgi:hypothetical protein
MPSIPGKMAPCPKCQKRDGLTVAGQRLNPRHVACACGYRGPLAIGQGARSAIDAHNRQCRAAADNWYEDASIRLLELGFSQARVAGMVGVTPGCVAAIALRNGIVAKPLDNKRWSKNQDEWLKAQTNTGKPYTTIARDFSVKFGRKVHDSTVRSRLMRIAATEACA